MSGVDVAVRVLRKHPDARALLMRIGSGERVEWMSAMPEPLRRLQALELLNESIALVLNPKGREVFAALSREAAP